MFILLLFGYWETHKAREVFTLCKNSLVVGCFGTQPAHCYVVHRVVPCTITFVFRNGEKIWWDVLISFLFLVRDNDSKSELCKWLYCLAFFIFVLIYRKNSNVYCFHFVVFALDVFWHASARLFSELWERGKNGFRCWNLISYHLIAAFTYLSPK